MITVKIMPMYSDGNQYYRHAEINLYEDDKGVAAVYDAIDSVFATYSLVRVFYNYFNKTLYITEENSSADKCQEGLEDIINVFLESYDNIKSLDQKIPEQYAISETYTVGMNDAGLDSDKF